MNNKPRSKMTANRVARNVILFQDDDGNPKYYVQVYIKKNDVQYIPFDTLDMAIGYRNSVEEAKRISVLEKIKMKGLLNEFPYNMLHDMEISETSENAIWYKNLVDALSNDKFDVSMYAKNDRETEIITKHYKQYKTLDELGKRYNVTKERIRQIIVKFLLRVKEHINYVMLDDKRLEEYHVKRKKEIDDELEVYKNKMTIEMARIYLDECNKRLRDSMLDKEISVLTLSTYTRNALKRSGYKTIKQLSELTIDELKNIQCVGAKGIGEVCSELAKIGITIK